MKNFKSNKFKNIKMNKSINHIINIINVINVFNNMSHIKINKIFAKSTSAYQNNKFKFNKIKHSIIAIELAVLSLSAYPLLSQAQTINNSQLYIRATHSDENQSPQGMAMLKFKELLEARANGKIKVDTFARHQKYSSYEELEALKLGTVEIASVQMSDMSKYGITDFDVMSLPFLFSNFDVVHKVEDGAVGQALANKVESSTGFKVLGYWDNGFGNFSANTNNLTMPSSLSGTKMATMSNIDTITANSLKATAVNVATEDISKELTEGKINALQEPLYSFYIDQYYNNQSKLVLTNHRYSGNIVLMNASYWNSLSQDQRSLIVQVMQEVTPFERQIAQQEADQALNQIKKDTTTQVLTPSNQDLNSYKEAIKPVYEEVLNGSNRNTLISIINEIRR